MTARRRILAGVLLAAMLQAGPVLGMGQGLKVCLESGPPPLSAGSHEGVDLAVTRAVADWLGRPLEIVWYEVEDDADSSPAAQINGLLSASVCQLAGGVPLVSDVLRVPAVTPVPVELPDGERRFVKLGTLMHAKPYRSVDYRLILGKSAAKTAVANLDQVKGWRLLAEQNSLADNLLLAHGGGVLRADVIHVPMRQGGVLAALARGGGDAALVEGPQFDAWRAAHPDGALRDSGYRHPLRVNVGFVARDVQRGLLELVDEALAALLESGDVAAAFERLGYRYEKPVEPLVLPPLTLRLLAPAADGS
ncbi:MAG: transporter substrate-binding domain-containing protein [Immundisolibacter sp.]